MDLFEFEPYEIRRLRWGELRERGGYETSGKILKYKKQQTSLGELEVPVNDNAALEKLSLDELASVLKIDGISTDYNERKTYLGLELLQEGEVNDAVAVLEENLETAKEAAGEKHPFYANALADLGWAYYKKGEFKKALELLAESMDIDAANMEQYGNHNYGSGANMMGIIGTAGRSDFEHISDVYEAGFNALLKDNDKARIKILLNMANLYRSRNLVIRSIQMWKMAKALLDKDNPLLYDVYMYLAKTYMMRDNYSPALHLLNLAKKNFIGTSQKKKTMECIFTLANLQIAQGKLEEAYTSLMSLKDMLIKEIGEENPHVALVVCALGEIQLKKGHFEKAVMFLESAQSIASTSQKTPKSTTLRISHYLAKAYHDAGFDSKAKPLVEDAIKLGVKLFGDKNDIVREQESLLLLLKK